MELNQNKVSTSRIFFIRRLGLDAIKIERNPNYQNTSYSQKRAKKAIEVLKALLEYEFFLIEQGNYNFKID